MSRRNTLALVLISVAMLAFVYLVTPSAVDTPAHNPRASDSTATKASRGSPADNMLTSGPEFSWKPPDPASIPKGLYSGSSVVTETGGEHPPAGQQPSVVIYYAAWCGHCKHFVPTYQQLARDHPNIVFLAVNCARYRSSCVDRKVTGYPTIFAYGFDDAKSDEGEKFVGANTHGIKKYLSQHQAAAAMHAAAGAGVGGSGDMEGRDSVVVKEHHSSKDTWATATIGKAVAISAPDVTASQRVQEGLKPNPNPNPNPSPKP